MFSNSVARCVAVVVFAVAIGSSALADPQSVPLTFDCSVFARITHYDPPWEDWVQYGTNSASVTDGTHHSDIAFTSGTSAASLDAHTDSIGSWSCRVGTLEPSHLIVGTTPELPAGTPLLLSLQSQGEWLPLFPPYLSMDVNRGTTNLIHFTADDMPYGGPLTTSALVVAGETLDVSFLQGGKQTDLTTVFTATSIPEPAGLLLLALGLVVARRRAS